MRLTKCLVVSGLLACNLSGAAFAATTIITIESWRTEDRAIWEKNILPVFEAANPDIDVQFKPAPISKAHGYDAQLNEGFENRTAGDIITCRPFDRSLVQYQKGYLENLDDLDGMSVFPPLAKGAWSTDDGKHTYCVPVASVIHGFIYNKDAFAKLEISPPTTVDEFYAALDKVKSDGRYVPMAMGTKDVWESTTMGLNNIGPTYWKGEKGRLGLLNGDARFTDPGFVEAFKQMAKWSSYLSNGYQAQGYKNSQKMFMKGAAAVYPAGSWEITGFQKRAKFELGVFAPPKKSASDTCYLSDHTDIGIGMNADSKNKEAVLKFLSWATTEEFANLLTNAAPGFFSLSTHPVKVENPLAKAFMDLRKSCESTLRVDQQILGRGEPPLAKLLWALTTRVMHGGMSAQSAAEEAQANIDSWYKPAIKTADTDTE